MEDAHFAFVVTNLDRVCMTMVMLGAAAVMLPVAVMEGWRLRAYPARRALRDLVAIPPGNPWEGLATNLVLTSLALAVVLCST